MLQWGLRQARKLIVAVIGSTVVLIGIVMIFTPGPAVVIIPLGLGILATEFVWARNLLKKVKTYLAEKTAKKQNNSEETQ
jgi:uncharacterized protein (TIGR02611 family)